LPPLGFKQVC